MPESKSRHPHHSHHGHPAPHHAKPKKKGRAIIVAVIFFALLGLGISYFIAPQSNLALVAGASLGAISGFLFGYQIERSVAKK